MPVYKNEGVSLDRCLQKSEALVKDCKIEYVKPQSYKFCGLLHEERCRPLHCS